MQPQGPLQRSQANCAVRAQRQNDEMELNGDCPRRDAPQLHDRCDLICADLPKVI